MVHERWRDVHDYEGVYQVSDHGNLRTVRTGKLKAARVRADGRKTFFLWCANKDEPRLASVLVLEAFVSARPAGMYACHDDGDCSNDHVTNLRWDSPKGNMADRHRHGTYCPPPHLMGASHPQAVLCEDDVRCIRAEPYFRDVGGVLAKRYGVNPSTINRIRAHQTWRHIS